MYAGFICDSFTDFELVKGQHDPIISVETFERNKLLIYGRNSRKDEAHIKKNLSYVLKGLLLCSRCNNMMYASAPRTGNGGYSPRYHCGRGCKTPSVPAKRVHEDFQTYLSSLRPTDGTLRLYKEVLVREANHQLGRLNTDIEGIRRELDEVARLRVNAIERFTSGDLTKDEKNEFIDSLDIRKLDATEKLKDLEAGQALRETDIEYAINFMESVDKQWADASFELQQRFQKLIFPSGVTYDTQKHSFGTSKISALYEPLSSKKIPGHNPGTSETYMVAGAGLEPATSWL